MNEEQKQAVDNGIPYSIGVGSTVVYKVDGEPRKLSIFRDDGDRFVAVDVRTAKIKYIYKELSDDIADLRLRIADIIPADVYAEENNRRVHIVDGKRLSRPMSKMERLTFPGVAWGKHSDGTAVILPHGQDVPNGTTYYTTHRGRCEVYPSVQPKHSDSQV